LLRFALGSSLILLVLCGTMAVYFYFQQTRTAEVLGENIGSRGAAVNLENTLNDLLALHDRGVKEVEPVQDKAFQHLQVIEHFVDKPQEQVLAKRLSESLLKYRQLWSANGDSDKSRQAAVTLLRSETLPAVQALRNYNGDQIQTSEIEHRSTLRHMAWGLVIVGGLGSIGGILLGYGLARSLRQNLQQLLVRVQGASEMLSQELPVAELIKEPVPGMEDVSQGLVKQVEQVVSKLQQREREVRRAEQLAAVGQLAAGMAHEIRNPLTSIKLLVQTTRRDPAFGALNSEDLHLMEMEIRRIEDSLQTFLDFARPPRLERTTCNVSEIVQEALQLIRGKADQKQVTIQAIVPSIPVIAEVDRPQLRQVFVNLGLNAIDAMSHGGTLQVLIEAKPEQQVECTVTDTGPGISQEILPHLFEPFVTGKETGLGLGLVVSRRIVEEHRGTLQGVNKPGGGAQFIIRLPLGTRPKAG
jgi:two-component system, NtrC family, sensor histidine kinase HydH